MPFTLLGSPAFDPVIAGTLAMAAAASGPALARLSRRRTLAQPVPQDVRAEHAVLGALVGDPALIIEMDAFTEDSFTSADSREAWRRIEEQFPDRLGRPQWKPGEQPPRDSSKEPDGVHGDVADWALANLDPAFLALARQSAEGLTLKQARHAGERVLGLAHERTAYLGAARLVEKDGALRWQATRVSPARQGISAGWMLLVGLLAAALVPLLAVNAATLVLVPAAVLILGAASLSWSLVDADTLYLDVKAFVVGTSAAWAGAAGAALAAGQPMRLLLGALAAGACASAILASSFAYRLLRGRDGMGLGDSLIVTATVGIPVTLTGSLMLGYWAFMAALVTGIAGAAAAAALRRGNGLRAPFAFGPYLAAGWLVASYAWVLQQ